VSQSGPGGAPFIPRRESGTRKGPLTCTSFGAGDRTRTGDPHLGKVMLYQLSHARRPAHYRCRGLTARASKPSITTLRFGQEIDRLELGLLDLLDDQLGDLLATLHMDRL
jgi:hypothetical protein